MLWSLGTNTDTPAVAFREKDDTHAVVLGTNTNTHAVVFRDKDDTHAVIFMDKY